MLSQDEQPAMETASKAAMQALERVPIFITSSYSCAGIAHQQRSERNTHKARPMKLRAYRIAKYCTGCC
ncbi:Uncharacterised protein [Bordetella pertussis]|nr:Uncharacterised protein [Bordetella pertussis]CFO74509.1 Uncharacterised protein [Bordetella pertussis]CFU84540.1 Uncharacterised protein [Bordetella pertussis]CPI18359.1 Uncharacterised protein [Bordetella pertussis]CPK75593.1 Uncharacterised protein [Bordetella pertussis]